MPERQQTVLLDVVPLLWPHAVGLLLPLLIVVAASVHSDPYQVFRPVPESYVAALEPNMRFQKAETLRSMAARQRKPDAFLFGGSLGAAYLVDDLRQAFGHELRFYNYFVSVESINGITRKVRFLQNQRYDLRKVVIVSDGFRPETAVSHLRREHPAVSGELPLVFYGYYATLFLQGLELQSLLALKSTLARQPPLVHRYERSTGEVTYLDEDRLSNEDPEKYYRQRQPALLGAHRKAAPWAFSTRELTAFRDLQRALQGAGCNSSVFIWSPNLERRTLAPATGRILEGIFTEVHDFGDVAPGANYRNYYDAHHYRPALARWVLQSIKSKCHSLQCTGEPTQWADRSEL